MGGSKPKAFPAPIFLDEYDPGSLQSDLYCFDSPYGNCAPTLLKVDDGRESEIGGVRKLRLRNFQ